MAIVDDYAAIAAELQRIQVEQAREHASIDTDEAELSHPHRMRSTIAGEVLYRRLVMRRRT